MSAAFVYQENYSEVKWFTSIFTKLLPPKIATFTVLFLLHKIIFPQSFTYLFWPPFFFSALEEYTAATLKDTSRLLEDSTLNLRGKFGNQWPYHPYCILLTLRPAKYGITSDRQEGRMDRILPCTCGGSLAIRGPTIHTASFSHSGLQNME